MGLINLKTDLKSLKFGVKSSSDRQGSGNSNQPYIKDPIGGNALPQSKDFLLRGGLNAPLDAATDVARLTKMFFDFKSPSGILFIAKQNLLSRIAVNTQASGKGVNEGVYTPLTTLAQAGVGFAGGHLSKQGLIPGLGVKTYGPKSLQNPQGTSVILDVIGKPDGKGNRLVNLYNAKFPNKENNFKVKNGEIIRDYQGGPGSTLGIGRTNINFATDNKGAALHTGKIHTPKSLQSEYLNKEIEGYGSSASSIDKKLWWGKKGFGLTTKWFNYNDYTAADLVINPNLTWGGGRTFEPNFITSVYQSGSFKNSTRANDNNTLTWNQTQIEAIEGKNQTSGLYTDPIIKDFKEPLLTKLTQDNLGKPYSTIMGISPDYTGPSIDPTNPLFSNKGASKNIEVRVNMGNPGKLGNVYNYTKGKRDRDGRSMGPVDKITAMPIYESSKVTGNIIKNDLVKFRIGALGASESETQWIHFRAFIDGFSDSYSADWGATNYMGRGESFYKYNNFSRAINLSFTVAAQSREELIPIYKKLNLLASNLAPTYSSAGYMGGSLITLTLGGWCYELPGFISSLTLDIPQESPWEIAVPATSDDADDENKIYSAKGVKELPHIVKVSGFSFTPIHTFRPAKQDNKFKGGKITKYGKERYIALTNGYNTNYNIIP